MTDITVKKEKNTVACKIEEAIKEFYDQTGLWITEIDFMIFRSHMNGIEKVIIKNMVIKHSESG